MKSRVRTSVVVVQGKRILSIRAEDPTSGQVYFILPGGKIEEHETAPDAAERGCFEETGFQVRVDASINTDREYVFHWDGKDFNCLTIFYWARLKSPIQCPVHDADYNNGAHWIPISDVEVAFNYSVEILSAIQELMKKCCV